MAVRRYLPGSMFNALPGKDRDREILTRSFMSSQVLDFRKHAMALGTLPSSNIMIPHGDFALCSGEGKEEDCGELRPGRPGGVGGRGGRCARTTESRLGLPAWWTPARSLIGWTFWYWTQHACCDRPSLNSCAQILNSCAYILNSCAQILNSYASILNSYALILNRYA